MLYLLPLLAMWAVAGLLLPGPGWAALAALPMHWSPSAAVKGYWQPAIVRQEVKTMSVQFGNFWQ